ncbi:Gfo/Idh/MocA family protein [Flavihumibacter profundi]|jgi:predicted dehydrogenase|uniref:Gfo/Idh/MocA family protein n=1 Tax=Flavihumibacter profundi TaxID=2716883 RepID=UPI001CC7C9D7|nr:Gfo/Idh/MocA family oxidoreductase [Flavihumibacter profundi]MBZ5855778.1 Gfo/Idh/MocA family oxidoreductase [Flavihumibacter profundi]
MVKVGLIGAGKMGISHLAILGAHPNVDVVGVCDTSKMVIEALEKYSSFPCFYDYKKMLAQARPDAVVIAVPTKFHASMVAEMLNLGIHVFVEKPFCLRPEEGLELTNLAKAKRLVNQVGYHNKFVGTFTEVKRILDGGFIGEAYNFMGQAYGPVVVKPKQETWRSNPEEGGGCLMDYASHVIDLINFLLAPVKSVQSSVLQPIFSNSVEDAVYAMMKLNNGVSGMLSVNWSDETHRKMTTSVTISGKKGKIISDANELKVFFKDDNCPQGYSKGWNVKYVTDLTPTVDYYLRGEEYSSQMDYFIKAIEGEVPNDINSFESANKTDVAIALIRQAQQR